MTRTAALPTPPAALPKPTTTPGDTLRTDVQALRALAVAAVVLFHLWPNRLTGGYVGVDVFFVISGYLITSHLLREFDVDRRLHPARFWARRAKRLVPASSLVLLVTTVGVLVWVPRRLWDEFLIEVAASAVQVENWVLAHDSVDYLAATTPPSPTQHFWTLSVEEQFYVGLPILLLVVGLVTWRGSRRRRWVTATLTAVFVASLAYSVAITDGQGGLGFFSTLTRAWEFAAGALLACVSAGLATRAAHRAPSRWRGPAAWLGVAAIVLACVAYGADTPFPGFYAALPVGGTVLAIAAGSGTTLGRAGRVRPVAVVGRISYAAYLWHWPMIVLLPFATGHDLTTTDKLGIIAATLVISYASTRFVENPIRFGPRLLGRRRPRVVAAWCALPVALVVTLALSVRHTEDDRQQQVAVRDQQIAAEVPRCLGAQAADPTLAPCRNPRLDGVLVPDVAVAARDDANLAQCWTYTGKPNVCSLGPATGYRKKVLAIGDSHNNTLIDVYRSIAERNRWRVDVAGRGGCYYTTARQKQQNEQKTADCTTYAAALTGVARAGNYQAVIVTHEAGAELVAGSGKTERQTEVDGLVAAWRQLPEVPIVAIRDNPSAPGSHLDCIAKHPDDAAEACAESRRSTLRFDGSAEAAARVPRAKVLDFTSFYCTATVCPPVIGHVIVMRDHSHLTRTYLKTMVPYMNRAVVNALR